MSLSINARVNSDVLASAIQDLRDFVAIPSVSNPESPDYSMQNLKRAADFANRKLELLGFTVTQVSIQGESSDDISAPFLLGERIVDAAKPTLLFYGHYDVQPVDREHWDSDPFVLVERDGRLYGRGSSDDKGGIIAIITALGIYQKAYGALPCNVKVLFEGEEEYGSSHMVQLIEQERARLKADALIVVDGGNRDVHIGTLTNSTRGLLTFKLNVERENDFDEAEQSKPDLAKILAKVMTSFENPREISGFMDDCILLTPSEKERAAKESQSVEEYASNHDLFENVELRGDPGLSVYERIFEEPSISFVNGRWGTISENSSEIHNKGVWGQPNGGNSIQESAKCEIKIQLSLDQNPQKVADALNTYLLAQPAKGAKVTLEQTAFEEGSLSFNLEVKIMPKPTHSGIACLVPDPSQILAKLMDSLKNPKCIDCEASSISFLRGAQAFAECEVGVRLTGGQDPEKVAKVLINYVNSQAIPGVKITLEQTDVACFAWKGDLSRPLAQKYLETLGENFPETHVQPCGGAIPFFRDFQETFPDIEIIMPGVEDPKCSAHSHNESQHIDLFERATNTIISFLEKIGK